ncbi:MAG: exopolyphosphatase [Phyllobacteriaceae bacterium]|nr:exopolyphosphatase [Phyllobacteriaceae bacterium]
MDGLVCAVLLQELDLIGEILFVHPKDMQDGEIPVTARDITTNLPYVPGVFIAFDHHDSETLRVEDAPRNQVIDVDAPSAARVVYEFFGGEKRFPWISPDMMAAVDKADAASFSLDEVVHPKGWELLSFIMDSRTGLGRFREFRISNYQLMMNLIEYCRIEPDIDRLLALPDVKERVDFYFEQYDKFADQVRRNTRVHMPMAVLDLRKEEVIHAGNRFMIYALFPETNISCHVMWAKGGENVMLALGKSIFNRSNATNIGDLMLEYGGGGHAAAGTCQVPANRADEVLAEIIGRVERDQGLR